MLGMRTPDLEFLVLNDFEDIKDSDFFKMQEILFGKTIMDICLSDPEAIRESLHHFEKTNDNLKGTIIAMLTDGDEVRRDAFKDIEHYPK